MNQPFFSVIVPIYNCENYIDRCIHSIQNQTFKNYELIIIDDGSTDSTFTKCMNAIKHDSRAYLRKLEKNKGPVIARDTGLGVAKGKYIIWVDGDDYIDPTRFETLHNEILKNKVDVVVTGYIHEYSNGKRRKFKDTFFGKTFRDQEYENIKPHIFEFNKRTGMRNVHTILWSKAIKRELLMISHNIIPSNIVIGDDTPRTYTALLAAKSISFLNDFSYHYMENPGQLMKSLYRSEYFKNSLQLYIDIKDINDKLKLTHANINYAISQNIAITGVFAISNERHNQNKEIKKSKIREICNNAILNEHLTIALEKQQNLYFRFILFLIRKRKYRLINLYLKIYNLLLG